jgi:hypothetical protein
MTEESSPPDLQELARRYLDLWQDHLNAVARDADTSETLARTMALMNSGAQAFAEAANTSTNTADAKATDDEPPTANDGAVPVAVAPGNPDPRLDEFNGRLAAVEKRIADIESGLAELARRADGGDQQDDP